MWLVVVGGFFAVIGVCTTMYFCGGLLAEIVEAVFD